MTGDNFSTTVPTIALIPVFICCTTNPFNEENKIEYYHAQGLFNLIYTIADLLE
jgi:hypothetical protein